MKNTFLVITSIANQEHPVLNQFATEAANHQVPFIMIGDTKSPKEFKLSGCDFYSIERQESLGYSLSENLPVKHYARKNIGYLVAIAAGAETIIETDDDNLPYKEFWHDRSRNLKAHTLTNQGWVNVYRYFTKAHIWPRGFAL